MRKMLLITVSCVTLGICSIVEANQTNTVEQIQYASTSAQAASGEAIEPKYSNDAMGDFDNEDVNPQDQDDTTNDGDQGWGNDADDADNPDTTEDPEE